MGALAVVLSRGRPAPDDTDLVRDMLAASPHRGADVVIARRGSARIGVARRPESLDDTDLFDGSSLMAAVEGRLDNRVDLARDLGLPAGATAGQVVGAAVGRYGARDAAGRLRGRLACVVTDGHELWAWRDHLGFAPLFYRVDDELVVLATEAKQVARGAGIVIRPDVDVVESIVFGRYDDATPAAVAGVSRLAKSTMLHAPRAGSALQARYWNPGRLLESADRLDPASLQERFDELFGQACRRALTARSVISLSGGLDSPAVAAYSVEPYRALGGHRLPALTTTYPAHPEVDETRWVQLVADRLDLDLATQPHDPDAARTSPLELREWVMRFDGPIPLLAITELDTNYRVIADRGHATVLTGEMAEFVVDMREDLVAHLIARGRLRAAGERLLAQRRRGAQLSGLGRQVIGGALPVAAVRAAARLGHVRRPEHLPRWVSRDAVAGFAADSSPREAWRRRQLGAVEGPGLSIEADDVIQATHGVVTRRPWADVDLFELFLSLPAEQKFPVDDRRKALARELLRGRVPDEIVDRRDKTVFNSAALDSVNVPGLLHWLRKPDHRFPGIDYPAMVEQLEQGRLDVISMTWAQNLASAHAFLEAA